MARGNVLTGKLVIIWQNPHSYYCGAESVQYDLSNAKAVIISWRDKDSSGGVTNTFGTVFLPIGYNALTWMGGYSRTINVQKTGVSWSVCNWSSYPSAAAIPQVVYVLF